MNIRSHSSGAPRTPHGKRAQRGSVLILAALVVAAGAVLLGVALDTSRTVMAAQKARSRADAAALAATLELDATAEGVDRAREAALRYAGPSKTSVEFAESGKGPWSGEGNKESRAVRVTLTVAGTNRVWNSLAGAERLLRIPAAAEQKEQSDLQAPRLSLAVPDADAEDRGLRPGAVYELRSDDPHESEDVVDLEASQEPDDREAMKEPVLAAVALLDGTPKERVIGVAAFLLLPARGGATRGEYVGGYMQGSRRRATGDVGYYVATLVR